MRDTARTGPANTVDPRRWVVPGNFLGSRLGDLILSPVDEIGNIELKGLQATSGPVSYVTHRCMEYMTTYSTCIDAHRDPLGMRAAAIAADAQLRVIGIPAGRSRPVRRSPLALVFVESDGTICTTRRRGMLFTSRFLCEVLCTSSTKYITPKGTVSRRAGPSRRKHATTDQAIQQQSILSSQVLCLEEIVNLDLKSGSHQ